MQVEWPLHLKITTMKHVLKRNGSKEVFDGQRLRRSIAAHTYGLDPGFVDVDEIVSKVFSGVCDEVSACSLEDLVAETIAYLSTKHPDHSMLAGRYKIGQLHKRTESDFGALVDAFYHYVHPRTRMASPLVSGELYAVVMAHRERLNRAIDYRRDFEFDYFGYKTLERSYLLRTDDGSATERPQHMLMRVALGIHLEDIDAAIETYDLMSRGFFIHASPTLFNAGTTVPQMSSCFLVSGRACSDM
jgi:ribonucleoside-diphosphate reductase subunit M1